MLTTLNNLKPNTTAKIISVENEDYFIKNYKRTLLELGFIRNKKITVKYSTDNLLLIQIDNSVFALDTSLANYILVEYETNRTSISY